MSAYMYVKHDQCTLMWSIINISLFNYDACLPIYSPIFRIESSSGSVRNFKLIFYRGLPSYYSKCAAFMLDLNSKDSDVLNFKYSIEIIAVDGTVFHSKTKQYDPDPAIIDGWDDYIENDSLQDKAINFPGDILIFRCRLHDSLDFPSSFKAFGETTVGIDRINFNYYMENLNTLSRESLTYECPASVKYTMYVGRLRDNITVELIKHGEPNLEHLATLKMILFDINGMELYSNTYRARFTNDNLIFCVPLIPLALIPEEQTLLPRKIAFNLLCEFTVASRKNSCTVEMFEHQPSQSLNVSHSYNKLTDIQKSLLSQYTERKHTDVTLQVGDTAFDVHKFILSARSPAFSEIFENSNSMVINISNVETELFDVFLKYLYSGFWENLSYETAFKLLVLAEKYTVPILKDKCLYFLSQIISEDYIEPESP